MKKRFEYIWLDGNETPRLRSKTRFATEVSPWNFDGGSTEQGTLTDSDRSLDPVATYRNPFDGGYLVLCEVSHYDGKPHKSNHRADLHLLELQTKDDPWIGFEQEFTLMDRRTGLPLGITELNAEGQGQYYCGVGADNIIGRDIMLEFEQRCDDASIEIEGINAEVMAGQWEYQTPPLSPLKAADNLWITRYILDRICEERGIVVSYDPKPWADYNGAGCHTNYSNKVIRERMTEVELTELIDNLWGHHTEHIRNCGEGIERRMTGDCETSDWKVFSWGVGDRGASVRVPTRCHMEKKGYIEDRRPCANIDPYKLIFSLLTSTKKSKDSIIRHEQRSIEST
jgi:glutamine synthetase